ncbi:MAG: hypothetical protein ACYDAR_08250 [Thermomicrobiales bacterium]
MTAKAALTPWILEFDGERGPRLKAIGEQRQCADEDGCRLQLVNVNRTGHRQVSECAIAQSGTVVWLKDYGEVRVFRVVTPDGETGHWATNDVVMDEGERRRYAEFSWGSRSTTAP